MEKVVYSMSCGKWGDGKSICLWRSTGRGMVKIARFQSDEAAALFAEEFQFPLSDSLKVRLGEP